MREREQVERCAKQLMSLADPNRLQMIDALFATREMTVSGLASLVGIHITMASHHLSVLHKSEIVICRRTGRYVFYSLHPRVKHFRNSQQVKLIDLGCCAVNFEQSIVPPPSESPLD